MDFALPADNERPPEPQEIIDCITSQKVALIEAWKLKKFNIVADLSKSIHWYEDLLTQRLLMN